MNYLKISTCSLCDGVGVRVVLWVSGCSHHCQGCHNQCSWDYEAGKPFTTDTVTTLLNLLNKPYIKGLTFSGGDPLAEKNRGIVSGVAETVKRLLPEKDIWCYTGFLWEDVRMLPVMEYIDYLVDGKFQIQNRDISLAFRGSTNQRIIDVRLGKEITWL